MMARIRQGRAASASLLGGAAALLAAVAAAQTEAPSAETPAAAGLPPGCALSGSPNVFIEGQAMLRLGDVMACPGLRYEPIPGVFVNGQQAVRLLPPEDEQGAGGGSGASSVFIGGAPASRQGDAR